MSNKVLATYTSENLVQRFITHVIILWKYSAIAGLTVAIMLLQMQLLLPGVKQSTPYSVNTLYIKLGYSDMA